jgi:hypothetical protein
MIPPPANATRNDVAVLLEIAGVLLLAGAMLGFLYWYVRPWALGTETEPRTVVILVLLHLGILLVGLGQLFHIRSALERRS